jgi:hypothetical protein
LKRGGAQADLLCFQPENPNKIRRYPNCAAPVKTRFETERIGNTQKNLGKSRAAHFPAEPPDPGKKKTPDGAVLTVRGNSKEKADQNLRERISFTSTSIARANPHDGGGR